MTERKHQVLLVNFTTAEAGVLKRVGFNVDVGFIGEAETINGTPRVPYHLPHPFYEYDVFVYNSVCPAKLHREFRDTKNLLDDLRVVQILTDMSTRPTIRIALLGACANLLYGGAPLGSPVAAHDNVSKVEFCEKPLFAVDELHEVLRKRRKNILLPVAQFYVPKKETYPLHLVPAYYARSGDLVGAYVMQYGRAVPHFLVLPQFNDNSLR